MTKRTRPHMQPSVSGSNDGVLACSPDALIARRTMQGISRARNGFVCGRNRDAHLRLGKTRQKA